MSECKEGWADMWNAKAMHYVVDGRSLCGRWLYLGGLLSPTYPRWTACAGCAKRQHARQEKALRSLFNFYRNKEVQP